jgi:hypothetical protein
MVADSIPPAAGGVLYYPAQKRGTFPSVKAALASIGCHGAAAASLVAQAKVNASPAIAVPVTFAAHPGDQFAALIVRKPGGAAVLWLGCPEVADEDRDFAEDAARQFAKASGTEWAIFEWVRQSGAMQ